jgi:hypothetical protein
MSSFFERLLRHQKWQGGFDGRVNNLATWTAFKHEMLDAGGDEDTIRDEAAYALSSLISGAIESGDLQMEVMTLVGEPDVGEVSKYEDCADKAWIDDLESVRFDVSGHGYSYDLDGSKHYYGHGGANGRRMSFSNGLAKVGNIVVRFEGLMYGPKGWIAEQED